MEADNMGKWDPDYTVNLSHYLGSFSVLPGTVVNNSGFHDLFKLVRSQRISIFFPFDNFILC